VVTPVPVEPLLGFAPSNIAGVQATQRTLGDFVVDTNNCRVSGRAGTISCLDSSRFAHAIVTSKDGTELSVFVVKSLHVTSKGMLQLAEDVPIAIVALERATVAGQIYASGGGAGGDTNEQYPGAGIPSGRRPGYPERGGGGGSFCGSGGDLPTASPTYGTRELIPLIGGSSGGLTEDAHPGAGGGAFELVAGEWIEITGSIHMDGSMGEAGIVHGAGGGSGGAILLESPMVSVTGTLSANGAKGGLGKGGLAAGVGSSGTNLQGQPGTSSSSGVGAGGGGGGAGWIRINTLEGRFDFGAGALSPAPNTSCVSVGAIAVLTG
jgi:hypothetical protein